MKYIHFLVSVWMVLLIGSLVPQDACSATSSEANEQMMEKKLNEMAQLISKNLSKQKTYKIALLDFSDLEGNVTNLGRYLAEELTARLFSTHRFQIIERRMINSIMQEQKLKMTGLIDEDTTRNVGHLLGADVIMTGSIADFGPSIKVNARMIDPTSGEVVAVASVDIINDNKVKILQGKAITPTTADSPSSAAVTDQFVGIWKDYDDDKEYYYEIKSNGFVFYCELAHGDVVDLDTGTLSGSSVTYSGGDQEDITKDIADSDRVSNLPPICR